MRTLFPVLLLAACSEYEVLTDTREESIVEHFEVSGAKSDILFYGDTSYSMQRELVTLGGEISRFVSRVSQGADDWQILAVTGPSGCGVGGIMTPETPSLKDTFSTAITTPPGHEEADEWGLFNVFKASLESAPGGCNEGFIRRDATLHVVFFSDEDDNSPGWQLGGDYWRDYVDPIIYLKDDPGLVKFSAIVGPIPNGCTGADAGHGYAEATTATGGELISICDDWAASIEVLADASIAMAFFPLQHAPIDDLVAVEVNDVDRTTGWAYEPENQGVRFSEDVPGAHDEVVISYRAIVEVPAET